MIKLFASDLDGTLLPDNKVITPLSIKAIQEIQKHNLHFVITTGRPLSPYVLRLIDTCNLKKDNFTVVFNGAMIYQNNKLIYSCPLSNNDINELENFAANFNVCTHVFTTDNAIHIKNKNEFSTFVASTNEILPAYEDYHNLNNDIIKFSIVAEDKEIRKVIENIPNSFRQKYNIFRSYNFLLEFVNKDVDKLNAIKQICSSLNISLDEVMAFGDEENDYNMVKGVGYGVTPRSGRDKLKDVAKLVCDSNNDDGVAKTILKYFKEI